MKPTDYESILSAFEKITIVLDENYIIQHISESVSELLGYNENDLIGNEIKRIILPKDFHVIDEFLKIKMDEINSGLIHLWTKNQAERKAFIQLRKKQIDAEVKILVVINLLENIELSFEQLHLEKELFRLLMDNLPDPIYFKDKKSRFIDVSKAMTHVFGVDSVDEIIGKTDFDFHPESHAKTAFSDEQHIMETGTPIINQLQEETWKTREETVYTLSTKMPIQTTSGEIVGTFGVSKDITNQKQLENKLAKSQNILKMLLDYSSETNLLQGY